MYWELEKKNKEVRDTQDKLSQKENEVVSSQIGAIAFNTSICSREGSEEVPPLLYYYSHLQSFEAIHQEAADITKTFLNSLLPHLPKRCEEWFKDSLEMAQRHTEMFSWEIFTASISIPLGSEARQRKNRITNSLLDIFREVKVMKRCDNNSQALAIHSSEYVELVKNMITVFQTINFSEILFPQLTQFSKLLIFFVRYCNLFADDIVLNRYEIRMRELKFRSERAILKGQFNYNKQTSE